MGEVELDIPGERLWIRSDIICYGDEANNDLSQRIAREISGLWNAGKFSVRVGGISYLVQFEIQGFYRPGTGPDEIHGNLNPRLNFFRIEQFVRGDISFVDELGSNTGYFKLDNLQNGSGTAAHEYGHSLGLPHPGIMDYRGQGQPGIMHPRGTWVDPPFQWDPSALPGQPGGTLNPAKRKVLQSDMDNLNLDKLEYSSEGKGVIGEFTNLFHDRQ